MNKLYCELSDLENNLSEIVSQMHAYIESIDNETTGLTRCSVEVMTNIKSFADDIINTRIDLLRMCQNTKIDEE